MDSAEKQVRQRAKRQATKAMERVAAKRDTISYSTLTEQITAIAYAPNATAFAELLTAISRATYAEHGVLLSAVVVHRNDRRPGEGFFSLAESLNLNVDDRSAAHDEALVAVHDAYAAST